MTASLDELKENKVAKRVTDEVKGLISAFLIVMFIRTFFIQVFIIPSGSMYPTLMIGDMPAVTKYSYGYSSYSIPLLGGLFKKRYVHDAQPHRGEVVVFTNPLDTSLDFIKRCVGLPGDRVQVIKGVLHVNGEAAKLERIEDYPYLDDRTGVLRMVPQYLETVPGTTITHRILKMAPFGEGYYDNTPEYTVPEGHYFMMGDNRDGSADSRAFDVVGFVPHAHLLGPAKMVVFSTNAKWYQVDKWVSGIRWGRALSWIN